MRSLQRVHSMRTVGRGWTSGGCHNLRDAFRKSGPENKSHHSGPVSLPMRRLDFNDSITPVDMLYYLKIDFFSAEAPSLRAMILNDCYLPKTKTPHSFLKASKSHKFLCLFAKPVRGKTSKGNTMERFA